MLVVEETDPQCATWSQANEYPLTPKPTVLEATIIPVIQINSLELLLNKLLLCAAQEIEP